MVEVELLDKYMDDVTGTIWVKIGSNKKEAVAVGGIYRQHKLLDEDNTNSTWLERQRKQEIRWKLIVKNWQRAGRDHKCVIIGDLNLDFNKREDPELHHVNMIEEVQTKIETEGFSQIITGVTRSWRTQEDSLLDHVWTTCPLRIVSHGNISTGASDHNIINVTVAMKDQKSGGTNRRKRSWKEFNSQRCKKKS